MKLNNADIERFYGHVDKTDDCWLWKRAKDRRGYGWFKLDGRQVYAHRVSYLIANGNLDPDLFVCHTCDNPPCVNPDHLWQGTHQENKADMGRKGRINGEKNPHALVDRSIMESILARHLAGETVKDLAIEFGYSRSHLYKVIRGDQWKGLQCATK